MKTLALFDFDGTLYKKDSLLEFTKFSKGNVTFFKGMLALLPWLIGLKVGILHNEKAKKKFITHFFKDMNLEEFAAVSKEFALQKIEENLHPILFQKLKNHVKANHTIYIVTASFQEWIAPWSSKFNIEVIGTKIEIKNEKLTGGFASKNCFGMEKVNRIKEVLNLNDFDIIHVYGSGKGDREMLQLSK